MLESKSIRVTRGRMVQAYIKYVDPRELANSTSPPPPPLRSPHQARLLVATLPGCTDWQGNMSGVAAYWYGIA